MNRTIFTWIAASAALIGLTFPAAARDSKDFGVLVMAHGGGPSWNGEVDKMLEPVRRDYPLELAFGMADPNSMEAAVRRLEAQGVNRIAVVRLFISGDSFRERTEQILGLRPGAPPKPADGHSGQGAHAGHDMSLWRIDSRATFVLSDEGLAGAPEMGAVLADRARALSRAPARESVLILAHGSEDDGENERWIASIDQRAEDVRKLGFRRIEVMTLREDWPEKRQEAEKRVRSYIEQASHDGGTAIVIPYRVQGFGPYAKVLDGMSYVSDGKGLLPSPAVEEWVRRQAEQLSSRFASSHSANSAQ